MNTKNILLTAVLVAIGGFSTLSAQSDCKQTLKEIENIEPAQVDTITVMHPDSYKKVKKEIRLYIPIETKYEKIEEKNELKVYYIKRDGCLKIHRTDRYLTNVAH
jgi:hypothetical protein